MGRAAIASSDQSPLTKEPGAKRSHWLAYTAAGLLVLLIGAAAVVGIVFYVNRGGAQDRTASTQNVNGNGIRTPAQTPLANESAASQPTNANSQAAAPAATQARLPGTWTGTYGPTNQPTRLTIKESHGNEFSGVLEQGTVRVAFVGKVDKQKVTFKETKVLDGYGWSLGENSGEISNGGRKMSGTGKDPFGGQFGMTYDWTFARQ
jgi:cytoskeletal protein RodZ